MHVFVNGPGGWAHQAVLTAGDAGAGDELGTSVALRRALAAARPDAFTPDLATSLGRYGLCLAAIERHDAAASATAEGLELLLPLAFRFPDALRGLLLALRRDHLRHCEAAGQIPDPDLLARIAPLLNANEDEPTPP